MLPYNDVFLLEVLHQLKYRQVVVSIVILRILIFIV